jgi:hypothetical protein
MKRTPDEDPGAALLKRVKAPPPLSELQVERIARRLHAGQSPSRRRSAPLMIALFMTALVVAGWLRERALRPRLVPARGSQVAAGEIVSGRGPGTRQWMMIGPGRFVHEDASGLALDEGRLLARGGDLGLRVRLPSGAVDVPADATVEIWVEQSWFEVAAYSGRARIELAGDGQPPIEVPAMRALRCDRDGKGCASPSPAAPGPEVEAVLAPPVPTTTPPPPPKQLSTPTEATSSRPVVRRQAPLARPEPGLPPVTVTPPPPELPSREPAVDERPTGDALAGESLLVEEALHALRQRHDPARALAETEQYRRRFPGGVLGAEVDRIALEALLTLGRSGDALAILEPMALAGSVASRELRVVRGELRAGVGRCVAALADFAVVLRGPDDRWTERALYGQAACRLRLGDRSGGERDLRSYLERFPHGTNAAEVHRALGH